MPSEPIGGLLVYVRHEHWLTRNLSFPLRMIGEDSIVEMSSSVVSLSRANAAGVAIGGASDITGNAGTIIVGSYRTVRASASDGTSIRIVRHVLPYRPIRVGNSHLRAAEWREREALRCLVECGRYCRLRWQRCGYLRVGFRKGQPLSEIFCRAFTCWSFLVG